MSVLNPTHHADGTDKWIRQYLTHLMSDRSLNVPATGLLPLWLDQQSAAPEYGRDSANLGRITIQHVADRSLRNIVLGPAGSGKTLLMRQLVQQLAEDALSRSGALLPLYIPLAFFTGSIEGTLGALARMRSPNLSTLVLHRPCILLVDALNDIAAHEQLEVLGMLKRAMQQLGPQGRWVINCRTEQWDLFAPWLQTLESTIWHIRPWNTQTIEQLIARLNHQPLHQLIQYNGCIELARHARWLGGLIKIANLPLPETQQKPGQIALVWIDQVFADAAEAHCISETCLGLAVPLLQHLAARLRQQQQLTLSRAAITTIVQHVADQAGVSDADLLTVLDATGILDTTAGTDTWSFRSALLYDLATACLLMAEPDVWPQWIDRSNTLPLLYGLLHESTALVAALIRLQAWSEVQRVLDANEGLDDTLAVLEATQQVNIDTGAALGRAWARSGNPAVAQVLLRWAIDQGRDDPSLYGLLGDLYAAAEQWTAAHTAYTDALQRDPANLQYQQALARTYHYLGQNESATTTLEQAMLAHHQQLATAAFHLGSVYEQQQRYESALAQYATALNLMPTSVEFSLAQARILRLLKRFNEARSQLRALQTQPIDPAALASEWAALMDAQGHPEQALVHLEHLVELGAATAEIYVRIGAIHRRHNAMRAAQQAFLMAVDLDPRCSPAHEQLAELAEQHNDLPTAAGAYLRLAELHPEDALIHCRLGAVLRQLNQRGDAIKALQRSIQLLPSAEAYVQLARIHWAHGETARALGAYEAALKLDPNHAEIAAETGWALLESNSPHAALTLLDHAAARLPNYARVLYDMGRAYEMTDRHAEAFEWYERAVTVEPGWIEALRATGHSAAINGYIAQARAHLARALHANRHDPATLVEIGYLHLRQRDGIHAEQAFRRALAHGCTSAIIQRAFAEALLLSGKTIEALHWLERIDDDQADIQDLRSRAYEQLGDPHKALGIARSAAAQRPRDYQLQRRLGKLALAAGYINEAIVVLETALTLGDADSLTLIALSQALLRAGKKDAALAPAKRAIAQTPSHAPAQEQLGLVLLALQHWETARVAFEQAIEQDGTRVAAWGGLAEIWEHQHSVGAALPYARHAVELAPTDPAHVLRLAQLLKKAGDHHAARRVVEAIHGEHLEKQWLLLEILIAEETWDEACAVADSLEQHIANDPRLTAWHGLALLQSGRLIESIPLLRQACALAAPAAPSAWWLWLGRAYLQSEQWAAAITAFEQGLKRGDLPPSVYAELAEAYQQAGETITAIHALQTALEHEPACLAWYVQLAENYEHLEWFDDALRTWQRAQQLDPRHVMCSYRIGRLYLRLGNSQAALQALESATACDPGNAAAWTLYARAAMEQGETARAVHAAARAAGMTPADAETRRILGEALLRHGEPARAIHCLKPLFEAAPCVQTALLLHESAQAVSDHALARQALDYAFQVAPEDIEVQLRVIKHYYASDAARSLRMLRQLAHTHRERADIVALLAEYAFAAGDLALAQKAAEHAVAVEPDHLEYRRLLGHIYFKRGNHQAARTSLQTILASQPHDATTAWTLGKLALERKEISEAIRLLRLAAHHNPDDATVLGTLGVALRQSWEPVWEDEPIEAQTHPMLGEALALIERAAAQDPAWQSELGWTRLIAGNVVEAVRDLQAALRSSAPGAPERLTILRRFAIALRHAGQIEDAINMSAHATTLAPKDPLIAHLQGQLAEQQADVHQAIQCYARAVALAPDVGRYHLRLGSALLQAGETEIALDHLEQATTLEPARAQSWIGLSRALLRLRQPHRALEAAQRATQIATHDGAAWYQLARTAESLGQTQTAHDAYERATRLSPHKQGLIDYATFMLGQQHEDLGRRLLQRAVDLDPDDGALVYRLAQLSEGHDKLLFLEQAVQLVPANAAWRSELALLLTRVGRQQPAITHLTQAVDIEPQHAQHWIRLSELLLQTGDAFAAEATLRRGLTVQPTNAELWLGLGTLLVRQRQWQAASEAFTAAINYQPSAAAAHAGLGHCLLQLEHHDAARQSLQQALHHDGTLAQAWTDLAQIHFLQHRPKEAIRDARRALAIDSSLVEAYRVVAEAALELKGDWVSEAHAALEYALAIEPHAADLHALQGWAYYTEGAYIEAFEAAQRALRESPSEAQYYLLTAYALRRLRRFKEATEALRKAVRIDGNYREAIQELLSLGSEMLRHGERA
ncbi:MAG TPA: tetratricopeptide repeat protein [Herpetosiphonaceae bacterium]